MSKREELIEKINELHQQIEEIVDDSYMLDVEINILSKQMDLLHNKKMKLDYKYSQKNCQLEKVLEELKKVDKE